LRAKLQNVQSQWIEKDEEKREKKESKNRMKKKKALEHCPVEQFQKGRAKFKPFVQNVSEVSYNI